jgi:hypothetical protein
MLAYPCLGHVVREGKHNTEETLREFKAITKCL